MFFSVNVYKEAIMAEPAVSLYPGQKRHIFPTYV